MDDQLRALLDMCYLARDNYLTGFPGQRIHERRKDLWLKAEAALAKEIELRAMQAVVKELRETNDMLERVLS